MVHGDRVMWRPTALLIGALSVGITLGDASAGADTLDRDTIRRLVFDEAQRMGIEPGLALGVAHAESYFDPSAESHKGARGVMQIMPATARGEYGLHEDILWQPRVNIRIGLHFLKHLLERYQGRAAFALSWYNGGSRVGPPDNPKVIPATKGYVAKVQRLAQRYRRLIERGEHRRWDDRSPTSPTPA